MERGLCGSGSTVLVVDIIVNSFEFRPSSHTQEDNDIMTRTMGYLNIMSPVFRARGEDFSIFPPPMRISGKMRRMQDAFIDCRTTQKADFWQQNFQAGRQALESLSGDRGCFLQAGHSTGELR